MPPEPSRWGFSRFSGRVRSPPGQVRSRFSSPSPPPLWGKRGVGGREGNFGKVAEEGERSRFCRGEGVGGEARAFLGVPRGSARLVSLPRGPWGRRGKVVFFCWGFFCSFLSVSGVGRPRTGRTGGGRSGLAAPGLRPGGAGVLPAGSGAGGKKTRYSCRCCARSAIPTVCRCLWRLCSLAPCPGYRSFSGAWSSRGGGTRFSTVLVAVLKEITQHGYQKCEGIRVLKL